MFLEVKAFKLRPGALSNTCSPPEVMADFRFETLSTRDPSIFRISHQPQFFSSKVYFSVLKYVVILTLFEKLNFVSLKYHFALKLIK